MKIILLVLILLVTVNTVTFSQPSSSSVPKDTSYVMPTPDLKLSLYKDEDLGNAERKIKEAFHLTGAPTMVEEWNNNIDKDYITGYHKSYAKTYGDIITNYAIISSGKENWFDYLTISFTCNTPNAFDQLMELTDSLNTLYKQSINFTWDEDRLQWTNGREYVYIQKPTRDEQTGKVYAVVCIMPKDLVNK